MIPFIYSLPQFAIQVRLSLMRLTLGGGIVLLLSRLITLDTLIHVTAITSF